MTVPPFLQWLIRRAHNAWNRWTLHAITGGRHHGMGWSAWAYKHSTPKHVTLVGKWMRWWIDLLFWHGHCHEEYARVTANAPLVIDWRTVRGFCRVMALLLALPALLVWWLA